MADTINSNQAQATEAPTRVRCALFDLDGVVFDTEPQYSRFWGDIFREFHPGTEGLEKAIKGQTLTQIFDKYFHGDTRRQAEIVSRLDQFERQMTFSYVPGFVDFVKTLRACNVKTAVVTSSNREKMRAVSAARPEISDLFDAILTSEDFARSKPAPDCYLKGAEHFGCQRNECIVFEDSFNGIKAGRAAGMYVIGLATTNPAEAIRPLCNRVISNFLKCRMRNVE